MSTQELPKLFWNSGDVTVKNALVLDLMGTSAAFFGLIALLLYQFAGEKRFDGIGAMIVGVTTAILAVILVLGLRGLLVGERAAPEIEEKIKEIALSVRKVKDVLDLRTMQVGPGKLLVDIEIHAQDGLTTDELEELTDKIKERLREKVSAIRYVQVELETPE
jgi:divalent metal cation (Fe/Co/Zn/Cd) transporter